MAADYSQIELRILAHFSEEPALVEAFQRGEDIHTRTAAQIMGAAPDDVTSEMRRLAKVVNFGILYGLSGFGLSQAVSIGRAEAQRFIDDYFATHPRVRAYIDRVVAEGRAQGYVTTLLGRRRYLPELGARNPVARNAAERMAANAPIQGTASDIIKLAMVRLAPALAARGLRSRMLLQVHDELLLEVPEAETAGRAGAPPRGHGGRRDAGRPAAGRRQGGPRLGGGVGRGRGPAHPGVLGPRPSSTYRSTFPVGTGLRPWAAWSSATPETVGR